MIANLPERPQESGIVEALIAQTVVGAGELTLNFMDAFCFTERCKESKRQRATALEIAQLGKDTAAIQAQAALAGASGSKRTQQTALILGFGVLGLATYFLASRGR